MKYAASRAKLYLDNRLAAAGGAGEAITAMCQFTNADNYAPLQVGQLKNVASVFYDRLARIGYNWQTKIQGTPAPLYPWTGTTHIQNSAPATIGQLKKVLNFEITDTFLAADGDGDGIPSWWESAYGLDPALADQDADVDFDQLTNWEEYRMFAQKSILSNPVEVYSSTTYPGLSDYEVSLVANDGYTPEEVKKKRNGDHNVLREEPQLISYRKGVTSWQNTDSGNPLDVTKHLQWVYSIPSATYSDPRYHTTNAAPLSDMHFDLPFWPDVVDEGQVALGSPVYATYSGRISGPASEPHVVGSKTRDGALENTRSWMRVAHGVNFNLVRRLYCLTETQWKVGSATGDPPWQKSSTLNEITYVIPASDGEERAESAPYDLEPKVMTNDAYYFEQLTKVSIGRCDLVASEPRSITPPSNTVYREYNIAADDNGNVIIPLRANSDNDQLSNPSKADIDTNRASVSVLPAKQLSSTAMTADNDFTRLYIRNEFPVEDFKLTVTVNSDPGTSLFLYDYNGKAITAGELNYHSSQPGTMSAAVEGLFNSALGIYAEAGQVATPGVTAPPLGKATVTFTLTFGDDGSSNGGGNFAVWSKKAIFVPIKLEWEEIPYFDNFGDNISPASYKWYATGKAADNWLPRKGERIIVDSKSPGGLMRNQVKLKIQWASGEQGSIPVYLKIFDIDDPIPKTAHISSSNPVIDTNGDTGGDNFGSEPGRGRFYISSENGVSDLNEQYQNSRQISCSCTVSIPASGFAELKFNTTKQPGDNFKAVVSTDLNTLAVVQVLDPNASGFLSPASSDILPPVNGCSISKMLTVWRQLNVEMDSMTPPLNGLFPPDSTTFDWASVNNSNPNQFTAYGQNFSTLNNYYKGGFATALDGLKVEIIGSTPMSGASKVVFTVDHNLSQSEIVSLAAGGVVFDDDGRFFPNSLAPMMPRYNVLTDPLTRDLIIGSFMPSYVYVTEMHRINTVKNGIFYSHYSHGSGWDARDITGTPDYWVAHLVAGYQPQIPDSHDGDEAFGYTYGETADWNNLSIVYVEVCRDEQDALLRSIDPSNVNGATTRIRLQLGGTAAHELAHRPMQASSGTYDDHNELGLMGAGATDLNSAFTPKTLRRFRRVTQWEGAPP